MKFVLSSFQTDPDHSFNISYKVDDFISKEISKCLEEIDYGYDLVFSISCHRENPKELRLIDQIIGRKKTKETTLLLSFPHANIIHQDGWEFDNRSFDFKRTRHAYRTYPFDKYIQLIIESLNRFFLNNNTPAPIDLNVLENNLITHIEHNKQDFAYMNEELMNLKELKDGTHFSITESNGSEWQKSEIGRKWLKLSEKYTFDQNGKLIEVNA